MSGKSLEDSLAEVDALMAVLHKSTDEKSTTSVESSETEVPLPEIIDSNVIDISDEAETTTRKQELYATLIDFMVKYPFKLFFLDQETTWEDFYQFDQSRKAEEHFDMYTTTQLSHIFLKKVLPFIFNHNLSGEEQKIFRLLNLHPEFKPTNEGYVSMPLSERPTAVCEPRKNIDYCLSNAANQRQIFQQYAEEQLRAPSIWQRQPLLPGEVRATLRPHTIVMPTQAELLAGTDRLSKETAALFSAALSDDCELIAGILLEPKEMLKRLRNAKRDFEDRAEIPSNCLNLNELLEKVGKQQLLKSTIADIINKRFL